MSERLLQRSERPSSLGEMGKAEGVGKNCATIMWLFSSTILSTIPSPLDPTPDNLDDLTELGLEPFFED